MSTLIKLVLVGWLVSLSQFAVAAMPSLKLPFDTSEPWRVNRGYEQGWSHKGKDRYALDFASGDCDRTYGKPILAAASGTVRSIDRVEKQTPTDYPSYGNQIIIDHGDGWTTRYAHLSEIDSSVAEHGERRFVVQGQKIGEAGGTGSVEGSMCTRTDIPVGVLGVHLHFALYYNGDGVKPEPMSGYSGFAAETWYASNNTQQSPAMTQPAISCVYVAGDNQFCWKSANATPASCGKAVAWILNDNTAQVLYNKSASDCPTYCTVSNSYCRDVSGSLSVGGFGSLSSFNLKINRFWVRDVATQLDLVSGGHTVRTGQALEVRLQQKAVNGNTNDYMRPGKDRVETDLYNREDSGDWRFLGREYTQAINLPKDATHTEHVVYTVPPGATEVCFKGKIDAEDEASENNEGDNWSPVACFRVDNNPTVNFITTFIGLTNTPTPVPPGSAMRARMAIRNVGTTAPSAAIRSSYSYRPLGSTGPWIQIADDGSDPSDLVPNRDHWEETLSAVTAPQVPGWYELRGCADYQNAVLESNETDNCLTTTFEVAAYPDLIITYIEIDPWPDRSIQKDKEHHPTMKIKNVGPGPVTSGIRSAYYWYGPSTGNVWRLIADDGTEAQELCAGCEVTETMRSGFKATKTGTHYLKACVDYQGNQPEGDEGNNCLQSAPITVK